MLVYEPRKKYHFFIVDNLILYLYCFRCFFKPPPIDRENSSGSQEPLSLQPMGQYGQFPVEVSSVVCFDSSQLSSWCIHCVTMILEYAYLHIHTYIHT